MISTYRSRRSKRHRIEESWRGGGSLTEVIDELVSPLRLREAVELIEAHSGIRVNQSTVYRWVRAEREQALNEKTPPGERGHLRSINQSEGANLRTDL